MSQSSDKYYKRVEALLMQCSSNNIPLEFKNGDVRVITDKSSIDEWDMFWFRFLFDRTDPDPAGLIAAENYVKNKTKKVQVDAILIKLTPEERQLLEEYYEEARND